MLGMLWVVGAPARLFLGAVTMVSVVALFLATTSSERLSRLTNFVDPFRDFEGAGWQSGHGILGMASGGIFGKGIGASQQKWGNLPEPHTDFIFAVLGEELGLVGTLLVLALFLAIAYAGIRISLQAPRPVRALHGRRDHDLADRADDDQHRHGARPAAGDRHPAARWCPTAGPRWCPSWSRSAS